MSVVQKDMKYLKEKQKSLNFFLDYVDISKLRLLQILNEEQEALNGLRTIKTANLQFLHQINQNFFKNDWTYEQERADVSAERITKIYFLVDAKENDEYTEIIYKKLEEQLASELREQDIVITFGNRTNLICQRLEFNIIQHFPYDLYLDYNKFIDKVCTLIEVGLKNGVFNEAHLLVAQQNQDNRRLVSKKLVPFDKAELQPRADNKNVATGSQATATTAIASEAVLALMQNAHEDYLSFFETLNIRRINWFPNVRFFKFKFIKSIIKQNIVELRMIEKIQRIKLEIQLLDEKRNKLLDEASLVTRWLNRVRKEKSTEATIILHSAFKLKAAEDQEGWDEPIRKKREQHDYLAAPKTKKKGGK